MNRRLAQLDRRVLSWLRGGGLSVRRLDELERGPLALLRQVPQVGFLLIAVVLLVDLAVAGHRLADERTPILVDANGHRVSTVPTSSARPSVAGPSGPIDPLVGPDPGDTIDAYFSQRHKALRSLVASRSDDAVVAVVSFTTPVRPSGLPAATFGTSVAAVLVHVHVEGRPTGAGVVRIGAGPLVGTLSTALSAAVAALRADAADNKRLGDTTVVANDADRAQQADDYAQAAAATAQADALGGDGAYIYGYVTVASPKMLLALASQARIIRLVDPGPVGLPVDKVQARGIFPEDKRTVSDLVALAGLGP